MANEDDEDTLPWYIELAESLPIWVYIVLVGFIHQMHSHCVFVSCGLVLTKRWLQFLLPIVASFAQIFSDDKARRNRKKK